MAMSIAYIMGEMLKFSAQFLIGWDLAGFVF